MTSSPKVRDFIRPIDSETSYCEMLQADDKHQWSSDGLTWVTPGYSPSTNSNGGSVAKWPRDKGRAGDERAHLSFWGNDGSLTGGCCSSSTATFFTGWDLPCKYKGTKPRTLADGRPCARVCAGRVHQCPRAEMRWLLCVYADMLARSMRFLIGMMLHHCISHHVVRHPAPTTPTQHCDGARRRRRRHHPSKLCVLGRTVPSHTSRDTVHCGRHGHGANIIPLFKTWHEL